MWIAVITPKWHTLARFGQTFIGRAMFIWILSLNLLSVLDIFPITRLVEPPFLSSYLAGSTLVVVSFALSLLRCPTLLLAKASYDEYLTYCKANEEHIIWTDEFADAIRASSINMASPLVGDRFNVLQRVRELGDITTLNETGVDMKQALALLSRGQYMVLDEIRPVSRAICVLLALTGIALIYIPLVMRTLIHIWRALCLHGNG